MILLKLSISKNQNNASFEIEKDELLSVAIDRALVGLNTEKFEKHETFNITVNGHLIDKDFWPTIKLKEEDTIIISPKIAGGSSGQIFKQIAIITISIVASAYLGPTGYGLTGAGLGAAVAGITIGATLLLNALIPPPVPDLGGAGFASNVDNSQMYSITGQSNQMKRLGTVPKAYGIHRMFPTIAATPYTELAVDQETGETIQYMYAIFDFGLGVMKISDLKIGDTPITLDSFKDFEYRFVDPMKPGTNEDVFDEQLESEFKYYRSKRVVTPLSLTLIDDGEELIQFTDDNTDENPQEIILDFVAGKGLFGYSSSGVIGNRSVQINIEFALAGTEDWHDYNDPTFVESFSAIGGTDVADFNVLLAADQNVEDDIDSEYYTAYSYFAGSFNATGPNNTKSVRIKAGQKKLLVPDGEYDIGAKVYYGKTFLGLIAEVNELVGDNTELVLDRIISTVFSPALEAYILKAHKVIGEPTTYSNPQDFKEIRVNQHGSGAAVMTAKKTSPVYGHFRFTPKIAGQYKVRVKRVVTTGTFHQQKADEITWGAITTAYQVSPTNTTKRHMFLELKIRATNQLNGNIQNLSGIVSSVLPVYDPDTETWTRQVTNNPAWVFCDLLTGEVNKRSVAVSRLDLDSIVQWADYCDEVPDSTETYEYLEPRFQCNFILDYETTLQGALNQVGSMAQASLSVINGKFGVLIDRFKTIPIQIFTPRNSRDFSSVRLYGPRPHAVKVKYIDPNLDWEVKESIVYDNGYNEDNATEFDELTSFATTNHEQAWRFGRYMIAQNRLRQETISLLVDFENLVCTRGDYVQITQDVMRVGGTPARVKAVSGITITTDDSLDIDEDLDYGYTYRSTVDGTITTSTLTPTSPNTFDVDGDVPAVGDLIVIGEVGNIVFDCIVKSISPNDDLSAGLTLIEKADGIFDYESTDILPTYDPQISETSSPEFKPPKAVTNLTETDNFWECSQTQSGYNYFAELVWDMPPGSVFELFEIWVNNGTGYKAVATTTQKLFRYDFDQTRLGIEHGFKVAAVSASGKKLQLIAMSEIFITPEEKITPPSDVDGLNMSITNQVLQLSWNKLDDCDVREYQIRYSPDTNDQWEATVPLQTVSKEVSSTSFQARTGVYMIKAVDYAGNQSETPAVAITTIPNLFDLNIIETVNDAPDFTGDFDRTELLGDAVILEEEVSGADPDNIDYYDQGYYTSDFLLDIDDVYSVRLQSLIRADGYKFGELMSDWDALEDVEHLNTATSDDWNVAAEYRATDTFAAMADWVSLDTVDHINYGAGIGFTGWRPIPTIGDATGRVFQFRMLLESFTPNVTPRLFDATVKADMPDRIDSFENLVSHATEGYVVTYDNVFKGPGTSPNIQISIDNGATGDYWSFDYKTLEGFSIRFYDNADNQVSRQFDVAVKGFGRRHTATI